MSEEMVNEEPAAPQENDVTVVAGEESVAIEVPPPPPPPEPTLAEKLGVTFTWSVDRMNTSQEGVILSCHWVLTGEDAEHHLGRLEGWVGLGAPPENWTPFAEVTADQAVAWVRAAVPAQALENDVARQIANQIAPVRENVSPPWMKE